MTVVATSIAATATAYSNQRKIARTANGNLWAMFWDGTSTTAASMECRYSTDDGATWNAGTDFGFSGTTTTYMPPASLFIDLDDFAHVVYKDRNNGFIHYRRGTPNAARTAWTWSSALLVAASDTAFWYPDIAVHREGTGWIAHLVVSSAYASPSNKPLYGRLSIDSGGTVTVVQFLTSGSNTLSTGTDNSNHSWPSIDFNHTGDGKTVAGGTPHLYVAWSAGATGAGKGIRFKKATYSAGSWTWGTEREIDPNKNIPVASSWLNCLFDGTRVIIAGTVRGSSGSDYDLMLYERDAADTTTTTRTLLDDVNILLNGSVTYDSGGNVYFVARRNSDNSAVRRTWIRSTNTLEEEVVFSTGTLSSSGGWFSAKRGYSDGRIEFIYADGTVSPYNVTYDFILLNATPNVPTNLQVTSETTDNTPVFSADISDPDTSQQIKGRFQIYQNDGTTLVGTVDSAFRAGAGTVTAEYASALAVGNYKVQAATVDDGGLISAYTAQVSFAIKQAVTDDLQLIWDVDALILDDLNLQWDVLISNQKDVGLIWNVFERIEDKDLELRWSTETPWTLVPFDPEAPVIWEEVLP